MADETKTEELITDHVQTVQTILMFGNILLQYDIPQCIQNCNHAHSIGPILDPTLYGKNMRAMQVDEKALQAALPLCRFGNICTNTSQNVKN